MKLMFSMLMVSMFLALNVHAQQKVSVTLEKAVDIALEKNSSVIQAHNTVEGQQSAVRAAYGGLLPTVDASGSYSHTTNWVSPLAANGSEGYSAGIGANLVLFDGLANVSNISGANASARAAEHDLNFTEQSIINQTHKLFMDVVRRYQLLKVNDDNLKRSQRQLERISESNKVGAVALADVYRQQVQVGSDELSLIQAQNDFENAKADLVAHLGVNSDTEYDFDFTGIPTDIDTSEFAPVNMKYSDFNAMVRSAIETRPDYQSSVENLNRNNAEVRIAQAGHYPAVNASLDYTMANPELSRINDNRNLTFRVGVSLPIFSGFSTQNRIEQAEVRKKNSEEQVLQSRRQISVDVRKALLALEAAEKQVQVTQTSVISAGEDRKIAEEKYNLGAGTLLDLLVAHANYSTALSNKVNAVVNYQLAKKQTEFVIGAISK